MALPGPVVMALVRIGDAWRSAGGGWFTYPPPAGDKERLDL